MCVFAAAACVGPSGRCVLIRPGRLRTRERGLGDGRLARHWRPPADKHTTTSDGKQHAAAPCWDATRTPRYKMRPQKAWLTQRVVTVVERVLFIHIPRGG